MPTLSQFPLTRLAVLRRIPIWAQALAVCALFAIAGVAVVDDYGMAWDELDQRRIAIANADYIATGNADRLYHRDYRYYGIAFEMPLLLAERALGLQDGRRIYLIRHLLTHLYFIAGGFMCAMLAYRMVGGRLIALLVMSLFLLHPRLYVHSFVNTKDIPFAVMLVVALYLAHRAFRKDTIAAFLLCGIGAGLAIDLRPFGLLLPPMILAMRALDLWQAGRAERKRILASAGIFLAATLATAYIIHPYYWESPLRFIEGVRLMSQHPTIVENLFMGKIYSPDAVPWNFIPVWFAITAPPVALLLGAIGCAAIFWQGILHPLRALRDREIRFRVLLLGCFALPVVAVIALQSNLYNGWRHMYFLWGPFCLLAAVGLHRLAIGGAAGEAARGVAARLPGWVRGGGMRRALAYGVAGVGLITTLTAMAALHPHEQVYFNALVDSNTPDALAERYDMDYWGLAQRQLTEYLLARYPDDVLRVWPKDELAQILPQNNRNRLIRVENPHAADFYLLIDARGHPILRQPRQARRFHLHPRVNVLDIPHQSPIRSIRAYGSVISSIVAKNVEVYRSAYEDVAANGTLLARSDFDIYIHNGALYYLNANCAPALANSDLHLFLHIFPADQGDLPAAGRTRGFEGSVFSFGQRAALFDGKCIHMQPLPDYPIARIRTGQDAAAISVGDEWRVDVNLAAYVAAQAVYESVAAGDYGRPTAQSGFDVYLSGNSLAYIKEPCAADDAEARFFLHIFPVDSADLPADARERGFANLDFQFTYHGAYVSDKCVATRELPAYPIERIRTGQFVSDEGQLWGAEFAVGR